MLIRNRKTILAHALPHSLLPVIRVIGDSKKAATSQRLGIANAIIITIIQIAFCYRPAARDTFREYFGLEIDDMKLWDKELPRRETINDIIVVAFTRPLPALKAPAATDKRTIVKKPAAAQTKRLRAGLIPLDPIFDPLSYGVGERRDRDDHTGCNRTVVETDEDSDRSDEDEGSDQNDEDEAGGKVRMPGEVLRVDRRVHSPDNRADRDEINMSEVVSSEDERDEVGEEAESGHGADVGREPTPPAATEQTVPAPPTIAIVPRAHPRQALCSHATGPPSVPPPALPPAVPHLQRKSPPPPPAQVKPGFPPPVPAAATSTGGTIATTNTALRRRVGTREMEGMDPSNVIESKLRGRQRDGGV